MQFAPKNVLHLIGHTIGYLNHFLLATNGSVTISYTAKCIGEWAGV